MVSWVLPVVIGLVVLAAAFLTILFFLPGPSSAADCGNPPRVVRPLAQLADQFQSKWDALNADLDRSVAGHATFSESEVTSRAERFLDRQELRSGLLVSRRTQSYRFAHLTFQEYLAAWQLSNLDFGKAVKIVQPRLRMAKWFEVLQLLGGKIAGGELERELVAIEADERAARVSLRHLDQARASATAEDNGALALAQRVLNARHA